MRNKKITSFSDFKRMDEGIQSDIKKYIKKGEYLFFKDDTHLNKKGTEVIAKYILEKKF